MKRAMGDLASFPDGRLFMVLSEGIPFIVQNAVSLDATARNLYQQKNYRGSEVIRGFAEEEAAKVLILFDLVRCPRDPRKRMKTAKYFYGHVAKRIYAMTCSYPRVASFKELCELVESECQPYYLDGPNSVDWIFWNSIAAEREQALYVDYVQDVTEEPGGYCWRVPTVPMPGIGQYESPECVKLGQALLDAGTASPEGLAVIANLWRGFTPVPGTDRQELRRLIAYTLHELTEAGLNSADEPSQSLIIRSWSFPLWPLTIKEPGGKQQGGLIEELREKRARTIEWIEETESKRNPPPAISRSKVEELHDAYMAWEREVDARDGGHTEGAGRLRTRSSADIVKDFELPSYTRIKEMFKRLAEEERAALLALAWFTRDTVANWPSNHEHATSNVATLDDRYQIGLGRHWLAGLDRWEEKPRPFEAGQWYRP